MIGKSGKILAVVAVMSLLSCMTSAFAFDAVVTYPGGIVSMPSGKLVTQREANAIFAKRQACQEDAYTEEEIYCFERISDVKASSELDDEEKARLLESLSADAKDISFGKKKYFTYIDEESGLEFCITRDEYAAKKDYGVTALEKTIHGVNSKTTISGTPQKIRNTFTVYTEDDAINKYDASMSIGASWGGADAYISTTYARAKFPNLSTGVTDTINGTYVSSKNNIGVVYKVNGVSQPAYHNHGKLEGRFIAEKIDQGGTFLGNWQGYIAEAISSITWEFNIAVDGISVKPKLALLVTEWTAPSLTYITPN